MEEPTSSNSLSLPNVGRTPTQGPKVSVVMAVHNGARYLGDSVDSVLRQTLPALELIIVDDGSTDSTPALLRQFSAIDPRIRVITLRHGGLPKALNVGIQTSASEFIARMDADDLCMPHRLERQYEFLSANSGVVAVGTQIRDIDDAGFPIADSRSLPLDHAGIDAWNLRGGGGINHPSSMIRRSQLATIGGYRDEFSTAQDLDLFLRLAEVGQLANLSETLLCYRRHLGMAGVQRQIEQRANAIRACHDAHKRRGLEFEPGRLPKVLFPAPPDQRRFWALAAMGNGYFQTSWRQSKALLLNHPFAWQSWDTLLRHSLRFGWWLCVKRPRLKRG